MVSLHKESKKQRNLGPLWISGPSSKSIDYESRLVILFLAYEFSCLRSQLDRKLRKRYV